MKRNIFFWVCCAASSVLALCFAVKTIVDYVHWDWLINSAPFSVCVLLNGLYFLLPAAILLGVGFAVKWLRRK